MNGKYPFIYFSKIKRIKTTVYVVKIPENFWTGTYEIQDTIAYYQEFEKPKIIYPNICRKPELTFDETDYYTNQKCFIIPTTDKYLLGILNSSVTFFLFRVILPKLRGIFYEPSYVHFKDFPIRQMNFDDPTDKANHQKMVQLVEQMFALNQQRAANNDDHTQTLIERRIKATDKQIDQLVYTLYKLTAKEIQRVENHF